jgi:alkanesulfonate monooxygenase SsuD/methylene tetrahydromethanopterin reductase-like flavin-dependent oxidoreductase (luciferase family)
MKIAIGLPTALPATPGEIFVEWAKRAEQAGFSSLGTIGRTVFDSYEELIVLAAAAAVTKKIGLATTVLIAPPREPVLLAKQAATLHRLSGGRLTLGLGVGWREDDFAVVGADWSTRGQTMDQMLVRMREVWTGERIGPHPGPRAPEVMLGGAAPSALERAGRFADAYIAGPFSVERVTGYYDTVSKVARSCGRKAPRFVTSRYFALGDTSEVVDRNVRAYYEVGGEEVVREAREAVLSDADSIRGVVDSHGEAGADELFLWTEVADLRQVELLAEAVF